MRKIARIGTRNMYLSPDGRTGMRYREARTANAEVTRLMADLDAEVAYGKATGLGDHAKVDRLVASIRNATGKNPWEVRAALAKAGA